MLETVREFLKRDKEMLDLLNNPLLEDKILAFKTYLRMKTDNIAELQALMSKDFEAAAEETEAEEPDMVAALKADVV